MKKLNLFDAIELKKSVKSQFDIDIHYHDSCASQYFELEETNDMIREYLTNYFLEKNIGILFNDKQNAFTLEEIKQC